MAHVCQELDLPRPYALHQNNFNSSAPKEKEDLATHYPAVDIEALGFYNAVSSSGQHTTFVFLIRTDSTTHKIYRRFRQFDLLKTYLRRMASTTLRLPKLPSHGLTLDVFSSDSQDQRLLNRMNDLQGWLEEVTTLVHGLQGKSAPSSKSGSLFARSLSGALHQSGPSSDAALSPKKFAASNAGKAVLALNCFLFSAANMPLSSAPGAFLPSYAQAGVRVELSVEVAELVPASVSIKPSDFTKACLLPLHKFRGKAVRLVVIFCSVPKRQPSIVSLLLLRQVGAIVTPFLAEKFDQLDCASISTNSSIPSRRLSVSGGALLLRLNDVDVKDEEYSTIMDLFQQLVYDTDAGELKNLVLLDTHDQVQLQEGESIGSGDDLAVEANGLADLVDTAALSTTSLKLEVVGTSLKFGGGKSENAGDEAGAATSARKAASPTGSAASFVSEREDEEDEAREEGPNADGNPPAALKDAQLPIDGFSSLRSTVGLSATEPPAPLVGGFSLHSRSPGRTRGKTVGDDGEEIDADADVESQLKSSGFAWRSCMELQPPNEEALLLAISQQAEGQEQEQPTRQQEVRRWLSHQVSKLSKKRVGAPAVELVSSVEFPANDGKSKDWQQQQQLNDEREGRELDAIKGSIKPFASEPVVVEYQVIFGEGPIGLRFKAKGAWEREAAQKQTGLPPPPPPPPPRSGPPSVCNVVVDCFPELRSGEGPAYKASMLRASYCSGQLRSGAQLVAINEESTVNLSFTKVMSLLRHAARPLTLQFREAASTGLDQLDDESSEQEVAEAVARMWREKASVMAIDAVDDDADDASAKGVDGGSKDGNGAPAVASVDAGEDTEEEGEEEAEVTTATVTAGMSRSELLSVGSVGSGDEDEDDKFRVQHLRQATPEMAWVQTERRRLDSEDAVQQLSSSALDLLKLAAEEALPDGLRGKLDSDDYDEAAGVNSDDYDEGDEAEMEGDEAEMEASASPQNHQRAVSEPAIVGGSPAAKSSSSMHFSPPRRGSMMQSLEQQQMAALNTLLEQKLKTVQQQLQTLEGKLKRSEAAKQAAEADVRANKGSVSTETQRVQDELAKARVEAREANKKLREHEWQQQVDSNAREQLEQQQQQRLQRQEDLQRNTRQQWEQLQKQLENERAQQEVEKTKLEEKLQLQLEQQLQQARKEAEAQAKKEMGNAKQEAEQAKRETEQAAVQAADQLSQAEEQAKKDEEARGVAEKEAVELQRALAEAKAAAERERQAHEKDQLLMRHKLASAEARREELAQAAAERERGEKDARSPRQLQSKVVDKEVGAEAEAEARERDAAAEAELLQTQEELDKAKAEAREALHRLKEQEEREKERVMQLEAAVEEGHRQRQQQVRTWRGVMPCP
jgi:hypothetical protein